MPRRGQHIVNAHLLPSDDDEITALAYRMKVYRGTICSWAVQYCLNELRENPKGVRHVDRIQFAELLLEWHQQNPAGMYTGMVINKKTPFLQRIIRHDIEYESRPDPIVLAEDPRPKVLPPAREPDPEAEVFVDTSPRMTNAFSEFQ